MFIDGPAGTGKTYLYTCIINHLKYQKRIKVAVMATTGIAATLIPEGLTMHRFFKLPIKITDNPIITIDKLSNEYTRLKEV